MLDIFSYLLLVLSIPSTVRPQNGDSQNVLFENHLIHPERCWYVHTSGHEFGQNILAALQQRYTPIISTNSDVDGQILLQECDGFIYINEDYNSMMKALLGNLNGNRTEVKNKKLILIYLGNEEFVFEDSVVKYLHSRSLNVLKVRIFCVENVLNGFILFEKVCLNVSIHAPFIGKSVDVSVEDLYEKPIELFKLQKWRPDFNDLLNITFRVVIFKNVPCTPLLINEKTYRDGIEYRIIKEVTRGWITKFQELSPLSNVSVRRTMSISLANDESDMGTCLFNLSRDFTNKNVNCDSTIPYAKVCTTFLVPKPLPVNPSEYLILPLSPLVWIGFALSSCVAALAMYVLANGELKANGSQWFVSTFNSLSTCVWDTYTILTSHGIIVCPTQNSLRIFYMAWIIVCLLVSVGYSTGYASLLTYPRFTKDIKTLDDMIERDMYWGYNRSWESAMKEILGDLRRPIIRELYNRFEPEDDMYDQLNRLKQRNYAVPVTNYGNDLTTHHEPLRNISISLKLISECYNVYDLSVALQKNSPYTKIFNDKIHRIIESGIMVNWFNDISFRNRYSYMRSFFSNVLEPNDLAALTLSDLQGPFFLLCVGLILSAVNFLREIFTHHN